jgi:environmental stress-induced protein Ves
MKKFGPDQFKSMPWKNHNGTTTELFRCSDSEKFFFRLSLATVSLGTQFSTFPEVDRYLLITEGHGVVLRFPEKKSYSTQCLKRFFLREMMLLSAN